MRKSAAVWMIQCNNMGGKVTFNGQADNSPSATFVKMNHMELRNEMEQCYSSNFVKHFLPSRPRIKQVFPVPLALSVFGETSYIKNFQSASTLHARPLTVCNSQWLHHFSLCCLFWHLPEYVVFAFQLWHSSSLNFCLCWNFLAHTSEMLVLL